MFEKTHLTPSDLGAFDIDCFKTINDELGRETGGGHHGIRQAASDGDVALRLGGEEFVLLLPDVSTIEQTMSIA